MNIGIGRIVKARRSVCSWALAGAALLTVMSCSRQGKQAGDSAGVLTADGKLSIQELVIVDENGMKRAILGPSEEGGATMLTFLGKDRSIAAQIGVDDARGPWLGIGDAGDRPMAEIGVHENAGPVLVLRDAKGTRRAGIMVTKAGSVGMMLYDRAGSSPGLCTLVVEPDDTAYLRMRAPTGAAVLLSLGKAGHCALDLYDAANTGRIVLHVDEDGLASVVLFDSAGKPAWGETAR